MPKIQVTLTEEQNRALAALAKEEGRSKRKQLAHSAFEHAKAILAAKGKLPQPATR